MRNRIAAQAARLMAEGGSDDFALAKRKAARQLGAPDSQSLPGNEEIEAELRIYRQLYQGDAHAALILNLRRKALAAMRFFEKYDPYLTGGVLKGSAGVNSVINVQLFAANEKELELFLLNRAIPFEVTEESHFRRGSEGRASVLRLNWEGTPLHLALYEPNVLHASPRSAASTAPLERAGIPAIERLIEAGASPVNP